MRQSGMICAAASALFLTNVASAQWVTFTDETATRLSLVNATINDAEEKDIAVADIDRDGDTDAIVTRKEPFSNVGPRADLLLMNVNGVLTDMTATFAPGFLSDLTDARDVQIADMDNDDWPDVFIINTFEDQPKYYRNLGNDGGGNWLGLADESNSRLPFINTNVVQFCAGWLGDVTGDDIPDIYMSNYRAAGSGGTDDVLLINDGTGNFTDETAARLGNRSNVAFGTSAEIFDIDNDGDNDIVKLSTLYNVAPFNSQGIFILYNDGTGNFDTLPFQALPEDQPYMFTCLDLNDDGMLDYYVVQDQQDRVILGTNPVADGPIGVTDYEFTNAQSPRTSGFGGNIKFTDIDRDDDLDIGVAPVDVDIQNCTGGFAEEFTLLRNDGAGNLDDTNPGFDANFNIRPHDFDFIDINGDGCMDMLMGLCTGWAVFIQNNCPAMFALGDMNCDGLVSVSDIAPFVLALTDPAGYAAQFPDCDINLADLNDDNLVSVGDIGAFVALLTGG